MTAMQAAGDAKIEPLYSSGEIQQRIDELAHEIAASSLKEPLIVAILKGSFIFAADLIRALHREGLAPEIDFLYLASYGGGTVSQGTVKILHDIASSIEGRDVVIVDDILDSGRTLAFAKDLLIGRGAARVLACVLIDKQVKRAVPIEADFYGFRCPPVYVVGYGTDLANRYRELPFVGKLVKP
jgi:hypoxanthine phosphoribosyltransferase